MSASATDLIARLVQRLIRNRTLVLLVALGIALLAGWRTVRTYAALRSDLEELLPQSAPSVLALDVVRARLPGLRHLGVVVDTGGAQNVGAARRFIDDLAGRARSYPPDLVGAVRVDVKAEREFAETYALQLMEPEDVAKLRKAVEDKRDWQVSHATGIDLLDEADDPEPQLPTDELRAKYEKRHGKPKDFPQDRFVSQDGHTAVLLVQASSHATSYESDNALISRVKADIKALGFPEAYAPGMRLGFAGDVATRAEELQGLYSDLSLSGLLVFLLEVGSVVWFFRSWRSIFAIGLPLTVGTLSAFGLVALPPLSIHHLNSNTAFLGSIVIGNGINSSIILLARYQEERWRGEPLLQAIDTAVRTCWRPTLAASLAAATAYASLIFTNFRGFNQFGWIGGIGMITCWLTMVLLVPVFISFFDGHMGKAPDKRRLSLGQRFAAWVLRRSRWVLALTALASLAAGLGLAHRKADWLESDFSKLRRRDSWQTGERYWGARMDATLQQYLTPTVILADNGPQARLIAERVRQLKDQGRAGGLINSVRVAEDLLPADRAQSVEQAKLLKAALTPRLLSDLKPEDRKLVDRALSPQALVPLEPQQVPDVLAAGLRDYQGRLDRNVLVFPELTLGTWDANRMEAFTKDLREASTIDGTLMPIAGSLLLSSDIIQAMKADGPKATAIAFAAVLLISVLAFRSLKLSSAAVLSLLVGVILMLGTMAWGGQRINFSNFVALPITFGIGADYAINMLKRYQIDGRADLHSAVAATGGAVAMCSLTTIIGYGSLLVAQNRALFSFGIFAVSGEFTCLAAAIVALPAALYLRLRRVSAQASEPAEQLE